MSQNIDLKTVAGFGDEWQRLDQSGLSPQEKRNLFEKYFSIFPWERVTKNSVGFDLGCGSGRWAEYVAPRVKALHCIDPSSAIDVARKNLARHKNCIFHLAASDEIPISDESMDFGYSLGVIHHIPDTQKALSDSVKKLKPGAPFLLYIYYNFDNRPWWYKLLWKLSERLRITISKTPHKFRYIICQTLAALVYWPLARSANIASKFGFSVRNFPLAFYKDSSFYTMRTDALDRFGTQLEKRFSKSEICKMMREANLENISFSPSSPFWVALGYKRK